MKHDCRDQESRRRKDEKSVESLKADFGKVRTGRATTGILDHVKVDYYGTPTLISQVANLTLIDAHTSVCSLGKEHAGQGRKAIRDADLGLNPSNMGEMLRVPMPPLTEERRKELVKLVRGEAENGKVAIRNIRRDAIAHLKELLKNKEISEDDERRAADEIQKLTDKYIAEQEKHLADKEKDLMAV
jgi:ribosome recycling factor